MNITSIGNKLNNFHKQLLANISSPSAWDSELAEEDPGCTLIPDFLFSISDLNSVFHDVILGLMNSEIEYFSFLAMTLYRLYYELFQEDNLLPIEINTFTERNITSCAVNSNQWIIAEHLFTSGQLKGYLPIQNVSRLIHNDGFYQLV